MPKIVGIATAIPDFKVGQNEAKEFAENLFGSHFKDIGRLLPIFDNAGIKNRYFAVPHSWFGAEHSLDEKNEIYIRTATELGARALSKVLASANTALDEIDYIIYVNTTGLATPSIDARLINKLNLRRNIRRTPIWGLGCAGGASGLSHAYHYLVGHPSHRVLIVAVELCGLTFIHDDFSKSNLVACALFADGAAAALVSGDDVDATGLDIVATQSTFYPDSLNVMGWNIVSKGMQVVFDKRIPDIVAENSDNELCSFLSLHSLAKTDISQYLFHPGGIKVVEAYEKAYGLSGDSFDISREILRDYGNMSLVTVFYVISRYLEKCGVKQTGYGVISALGPGFCSESLLVRL